MSTVTRAVANRKSVRKFTSQTVPFGVVRKILEKALRAPSGGNTQPWHIYAVTGKVKEELSKQVMEEMENGNAGFPPEYKPYPPNDASAEYMKRRQKLGLDMFELLGIGRDDDTRRLEALKRNFTFFDAPVGLFVTVDRIVDRNGWGHVGMLMQTIALLAEEEGLATCMQESWSNYHKHVYEKLGVPESEILWCGIALGYEDLAAPVNRLRSEREPLDKVVKFFGFDPKR